MSDAKYNFTARINHETCNKKSLYFEDVISEFRLTAQVLYKPYKIIIL